MDGLQAQTIANKELELVQKHKDPHYENEDRRILDLKDASPFVRYNPITLLGQGILYLYQNSISHQLSADCLYHPSCSDFAKKSIEEYGLVKGVFLGADRLSRCTNLADKDNEHLRLGQDGKLLDPPTKYRWPE